MIKKLLEQIFGTKDDREVKRILKTVSVINSLEKKMEVLSDDGLRLQTAKLRDRLAVGETLHDILPEAFATVREAAKRVLGLRHYDVQMVGGIVLHEGKIAEMRTGEGKTLVATAPVYLNALTGKGVHVITVNDYLAKRDKEWMGRIYEFLGLSTGVVLGNMSPDDRRSAYNSDITYGTNNEFGFDYLRDNMSQSLEQMVQRGLNYAIVDEVDSILVDEARTPLIISGSAQESLRTYELFAAVAKQLGRDRDYEVNEKENSVLISEDGIKRVESILKIDNLYSEKNIDMTHFLNQSLKAKELFKKDKDYIIRDNQIIIVDEFTGRLMQGRRYSEGLHQSIEAKEKVPVAAENFTLATITLQNYFRMYEKLSGMTGTAKTEEGEFVHIYNLHVVTIPTNRPIARTDHSDMVYVTQKEKFEAAVDKITEIHKQGQPLLIGTASIENSEMMSGLLKQAKINHNVLNAKQHASEAEIIAQAGRIGSITIATNMAGRGTDIVLGGNAEFMAKHENPDESSNEYKKALKKFNEQFGKEKEQVLALGGLYILGTERHESRRIDNQLRGRSGRQGDPGEAIFFLSLEDELMRMFGSERVMNIMNKMGYEYKEVLHHSMLNRAIENAQKRVEARNFGVRKQLLEYDDVINKQREVIYSQRSDIMYSESVTAKVHTIMGMVVQHAVNIYMNIKESDLRDVEGFVEFFKDKFGYDVPKDLLDKAPEDIVQKITIDLQDQYEKKMKSHSHKNEVEKQIMIQVLDGRWRENLRTLDALREGIHLRSYGQRDPIVEYKLSSSKIYADMTHLVREEIASFLFKVEEEK